ncbi:MAG TPA: hydrogenase maturation protease [Candidatus Binataceae bacterium]|nr:hydrogenase maturation protease [Candidatus Binataceae bacterium]
MNRRILVAGVGNIFLGDDGFGVEVARRLGEQPFPEGVDVADFGIRGVHLAYQLLEGYETLVLIDAASKGQAPGTIFLLEPDFERPETLQRTESGFLLDAHGMDPEMVLGILKDLGGSVGRVVIVGCEPADISETMGLSATVERAVDEACRVVRRLIDEELAKPADGEQIRPVNQKENQT